MRLVASIVLKAMVLLLSACAGREAVPYTLPTYGTPASRYTPIPPLGERMSTNGRVFIVADLDDKEDTTAIALWKSPESHAALSSVGMSRLLGSRDEGRAAWDAPRPGTGKGVFAYVDGREYDRDVPFDSAAEFVDWIGRVRSGQIDEEYADRRLRARGREPSAHELAIHGLRMMRLRLHQRALESLLRAWDLNHRDPNVEEEVLSFLHLRELSIIYPAARNQLAALAQTEAHSWHPWLFKGVEGPNELDRSLKPAPRQDQWAMHRFVGLCLASDRLDLFEQRLAECESMSQGNQERNWLLCIGADCIGAAGLTDGTRSAGLIAFSGRLRPKPLEFVLDQARGPLLLLAMSDAPRKSAARQMKSELAYPGLVAGIVWCQCRAAGREADAAEILQFLNQTLNYPTTIDVFLEACVVVGYLPGQTDEWLARQDLDPMRRVVLREGVEMLRRQPLMPPASR